MFFNPVAGKIPTDPLGGDLTPILSNPYEKLKKTLNWLEFGLYRKVQIAS